MTFRLSQASAKGTVWVVLGSYLQAGQQSSSFHSSTSQLQQREGEQPLLSLLLPTDKVLSWFSSNSDSSSHL